jgi:hypothetical protein
MIRRWLAAATFVALVLACASPTLPLPPPEAPAVETVDATHVNLVAGCGGALPTATINVANQGPNGQGDPDPTYPGQVGSQAMVSQCGSWQLKVYARAGDNLMITQVSDNEVSLPVYVAVQ